MISFLQIIRQRLEEITLKDKIFDISLSIFGAFLALMGFIIIFTNFLVGFFLMLSGVTLIPSIYERSKEFLKECSGKIPKKYYDKMSIIWHKSGRYIRMTLPFLFLILSLVFIPKNDPVPTSSEICEPVSSTVENVEEPAEEVKEDEKIEITNLHFDETELQLDINETKDLVLKIQPEKAETENLEFCTSNEEVASLEKTDKTSEENEINLKLIPASEGECEVFAKATNGIESNKVSVKIIDNERVLAEEKSKQEEEQKAKQEAELKAKEEAEKQAAKAAEEEQAKLQAEAKAKKKAAEKTSKASSSNAKASSSKKSTKNTNNSHGKQVYRTPYGKRYHFDPDCGGKNSYQITLDTAVASGLTPCKKCAR